MTKRFRTLAALAAATAALAAATTASATPVTATIRVEGFDATVVPLTQATTDGRIVSATTLDRAVSRSRCWRTSQTGCSVPIECQWFSFGSLGPALVGHDRRALPVRSGTAVFWLWS